MKPYADHFSGVAAAYSGSRPRYPIELFEFLAGLVESHELAWDCAAGSGQATIPLTKFFRRVVATDASAAMLQQAPRHPAVQYRVASAESSGLDTASVGLVTVAQALHWLDLPSFYAEVDRVLVPAGVLAVWTYGKQGVEGADITRVLERFYDQVVGSYWPPGRHHVEAGYRTLPFPYPELQPPAFEMEAQWTLAQLLAYVRTWSATQRFREVNGQDPVTELERELIPLWGEGRRWRRIAWPLTLRAGRRPLQDFR